MEQVKILFVCLGNICRSPTAEGLLRHKLQQRNLLDRFEVDSAGTGDWHVGHPPDERAQAAAAIRGFDISDLRARQVSPLDTERFDYVIAMDDSNHQNLSQLAGAGHAHKVRLLLEFSASELDQVPDPYYGGEHGFNQVIDLIDDACEGLIADLLGQQ